MVRRKFTKSRKLPKLGYRFSNPTVAAKSENSVTSGKAIHHSGLIPSNVVFYAGEKAWYTTRQNRTS